MENQIDAETRGNMGRYFPFRSPPHFALHALAGDTECLFTEAHCTSIARITLGGHFHWQANPTITRRSLPMPISPQERGLMAKITLDPVPALVAQPSVFAHIDATFDLLQPRYPVPVIASTSSSVSSLPFTPPSGSSPPERESNMMAISATGPGDDPATPVSHTKSDDQPSQHENVRTAT
ncbi:hypothetical protein EDB83DRAFT_119907 [Lactarius deliciosus]|nr:hypothetical protein EDB83DRAFT_119907 [Lactarius deliciosus]